MSHTDVNLSVVCLPATFYLSMQGGYELLKDPDVFSLGSTQRTTPRKLLYSALLIVGLVACSSVYVLSPRIHIIFDDESFQTKTSVKESLTSSTRPLEQCAASLPPPAKPPAPVNLWASLTLVETVSIHKWLTDSARGLNLIPADKAGLTDNSIFHIEVYRPAKAAALAYLESPNNQTLPSRYGRVSIHLGARPEAEGGPVIKDYLVGPLPIGDKTALKELTEIYHRDDIPFNARGFGSNPFSELPYLLSSYMPRLAHVTQVRCRFDLALHIAYISCL